jgi:hypothetical protein
MTKLVEEFGYGTYVGKITVNGILFTITAKKDYDNSWKVLIQDRVSHNSYGKFGIKGGGFTFCDKTYDEFTARTPLGEQKHRFNFGGYKLASVVAEALRFAIIVTA